MKQLSLWRAAFRVLLVSVLSTTAFAAEREPIDETRQVSSNEKITIEVMRGQVRVRANDANVFSVSGVLDELAEGFELESDNGFTSFIVNMPRRTRFSGNNDSEGSDLEIAVPTGSTIEVKTVNGSLDVSGVRGGSVLSSVNGEIAARMLGDFAEISTVNGAIDSSDNSGRVELSTINGTIDDQGSSGRVSYSAINGRINADSSADEVELSIVNGRVNANLQGSRVVKLSGVNGPIEIDLEDSISPRISGSTVSGSITVHLDEDINAKFSLRSNVGGAIRNGITDDEATRASYGPARSLEFTTGSGVGSVELTSVSGRLEVDN